jgi:hypothetical protein
MEDNDTIDVYQEQVCFKYSKKTFSISIDLGWWVMLNKKSKKEFSVHHSGSQFYLE